MKNIETVSYSFLIRPLQ